MGAQIPPPRYLLQPNQAKPSPASTHPRKPSSPSPNHVRHNSQLPFPFHTVADPSSGPSCRPAVSPTTYSTFCAYVNALCRRAHAVPTLVGLVTALANELEQPAHQSPRGRRRLREGADAIEAVEELLGWAVDEWDKTTERGPVETAVNAVLLAALSVISSSTRLPSLADASAPAASEAALSLILATLPRFTVTAASALGAFPYRVATALRPALRARGTAAEYFLTVLEVLGDVGEAGEAELVEAIAEGEVGEGTEVERRLLCILAGRTGIVGVLDGL